MAKKSVPRRLWDFGLVYEAELLSRLSRGRDGRTGYEEVLEAAAPRSYSKRKLIDITRPLPLYTHN